MNYLRVPIYEFENYTIDTEGIVRNEDRDGRVRLASKNNEGKLQIVLSRNGSVYNRSLAHLVAGTFLERPGEHFDAVIHKDFDFLNCQVDNLAWRPRWYAMKYHHQTIYKSAPTSPVVDLYTDEVYDSPMAAAKALGLLCNDVINSAHNHHHVPVVPGHEFRFMRYLNLE